MLSNPVIAYAKAYNFNVFSDYAYGIVDSFLVTVSNDGYKKAAFVNFFTPESEEGDLKTKIDLIEGIKSLQLKALEGHEVLINGVYFSTDVEIAEFDEAIVALCAYLLEAGMQPAPICSECGYDLADCEASAYISVFNERAAYICKECAEEANAGIASAEPVARGSKSLGVVGAVLGAFIAFIVTLLLYTFVIPNDGIKFGNDSGDVINSMIFVLPSTAVISILAFVGYRIFTGRKGTERLLPCFITSTLFTLVTAYSASAVNYTNAFGLNLTSAVKYNVLGIILGSPFTDPSYRSNLLTYGLFALAIAIVVTLIYSIIFDDKKVSTPVIVPVCEAKAEDICEDCCDNETSEETNEDSADVETEQDV